MKKKPDKNSLSEIRNGELPPQKKVDVWRYKTYKCKVKLIDIYTGKKIVVLNEYQAKGHDIYPGYRTQIRFDSKTATAMVDVSDKLVKHGEIGIFREICQELNLKEGDTVEIIHLDRPESIKYIKKKLDGGTLLPEEIDTIVTEIMDGRLSEVETSAWVSAAYIRGFSDSEIVALTYSTANSGDRLTINKKPILDKHSIGGVAGNRTTMVIVPIIAAAGLYIPKTSSRAITSAAGTADAMEVLAPVDIKIEKLKQIVRKAKGAMVWGGSMNLAPVDDRLIRIRYPLSLDPEGMLIASILAKKKSVGAQYLIVDIPVGRSAKVRDVDKANELARHFISIGKTLGIKIEVLITDGAEPIGNGIGPALECRDVLAVLEGNGPDDLRHKSILMAGKLLELCGKAKEGKGYDLARQIVESGKALKKMKEIIKLQGGNPNIKSSGIQIGKFSYDVLAERSGKIFHIDNKIVSKIARIAGAPNDKGAGIYLYTIRGDVVNEGDKIFTIYAESPSKLDFAKRALKDLEPIEMRKILLGTMTEA